MTSPGTAARFDVHLASEEETARLGGMLAEVLRPGDTVLLRGSLGAGKTALARAVIGVLLGDREAEIPSPSYTLVNVYETTLGPVWHVDLYRLSGAPDELEELGLDEAIGAALVLIEWPERLGATLPASRLEVALEMAPTGRNVVILAIGDGWGGVSEMLETWR